MNSLYELRDWFYECDRLLFLAEVHYHKNDVVPSEHKFAHELTSSCLEKMFGNIRDMAKENGPCVSCHELISPDELSFLKEILDNISFCKWDKMDVEYVIKAQKLVHNFANAVNDDILENNNLRGYPHIYNACKIR